MSERLYFAYDWIAGRELLDVSRIFNYAIQHEIVISGIAPRKLPNGFLVYQIGISVKDDRILARWVSNIGGDLTRLISISKDEFDQSTEIFSMNEQGCLNACSFYKASMSRKGYPLNHIRDAMKVHRLLRKTLRNWHIYTMDWNLPWVRGDDPFAQKVNAIVKHMRQVVHNMGGEIANSYYLESNDKKHFKKRFYVILPSYKALSLFTLRALPTLPMSVWSEISHEELPNYLETYRLKFGLYRPGLE